MRNNPHPRTGHLWLYGDAYADVGDAYGDAGDYEKAVKIFEQVINRDRDFILGHLRLISCYVALGRYKEAQTAVKEVLRINPEFSLKKHEKWWITFYAYEELYKPYIENLRKSGLAD
jgi:tetratricopeptide (TPR) repeat protein